MKTFDELLKEYQALIEELKNTSRDHADYYDRAATVLAKQMEILDHPDYPKP
jgi:hypothetical protein